MSWEWRQVGELWLRDATGACHIEDGYSGFGPGKNNAAMESVHNVGPIPRGDWSIVSLELETTAHGPYVLVLAPCENTNTYGRSEFRIHGDSLAHPGAASEGCIILPRAVRERVWESGDKQLTVV